MLFYSDSISFWVMIHIQKKSDEKLQQSIVVLIMQAMG